MYSLLLSFPKTSCKLRILLFQLGGKGVGEGKSLRSLKQKHIIAPYSTQRGKPIQPQALVIFPRPFGGRAAGHLLLGQDGEPPPTNIQPGSNNPPPLLPDFFPTAGREALQLLKHILRLLRKSRFVMKSLFCSWK